MLARKAWVLLGFLLSATIAVGADRAPAHNRPKIEIVPQLGHSGSLNAAAFSPDGHYALTAGFDKTLRLWDVSAGKLLRKLGPVGEVNSVAFSHDGRLAISGGSDEKLRLWDIATGKELRQFNGHVKGLNPIVVFSPDGRMVLSAGDTVKVWDNTSGQVLLDLNASAPASFSPDSKYLLYSEGQTLKLREITTGTTVYSFSGTGPAAFTSDGLRLISSNLHNLSLRDVASGAELSRVDGAADRLAFTPDGKSVLVGVGLLLKLQDAKSGKVLFSADLGDDRSITTLAAALSSDGKFALVAQSDGSLRTWEVATGRLARSFKGITGTLPIALSPNGSFILFGRSDGQLSLWERATGRVLYSFGAATQNTPVAAFSPDSRLILTGSQDGALKLWDAVTGKEIRNLAGHKDTVSSVAFSSDGRFAVSGSSDQSLKLWEIASGRLVRSISVANEGGSNVTFSTDGRFILADSCDKGDASCSRASLKLWETATGKRVRTFAAQNDNFAVLAYSPDGRFVLASDASTPASPSFTLWDANTGQVVRRFSGIGATISALAFSSDGRFIVSGGDDHTLSIWDVASGKKLRRLIGHTARINTVTLSLDGRFVFSGSEDGTARMWRTGDGQEVARIMATPDGEWLTMTAEGFFASSARDTDLLAIVRSLAITSIGQIHQSLFNPDLVREALAGDPDGVISRAAEAVNLDKVLDAGPSPVAAITSHAPGSASSTDLVTVTARITDQGKGIGRVEWRINGVTTGVQTVPPGNQPDHELKQPVALDPGENTIEVIAYERRNLIASRPARTTITYQGPADTTKPKLYVLAIGINTYVDTGWTPPGKSDPVYFPPLSLATADAQAFGGAMKQAGDGQYSEVHVTTALNADAAFASLDKIIERLATEISPRDTFVLYAAAHGYSSEGRYYLIPQDFQGGNNPVALKEKAVGQEHLQDWIANRIKAKKVIILLDTCESGALVSGHVHSRTNVPASEAAVGRLHEATGRPVLTAAASGKPAFEGYKGHGVFTYALLDGLRKGDSNNNGRIEVTELVAYVEKRVPELVTELHASGGVVKGITVKAARGANGDMQSAHFGSTGEDFALVGRLP